MALAEVARFLDLTEAQAAAAALRASGMEVFVQNENWGQTEAYLQIAMGGFRLWTNEEDADDARAFVAESRGPEAPADGYPIVSLMAVAAAGAVGIFGWLAAPLLRRRRTLPDEV